MTLPLGNVFALVDSLEWSFPALPGLVETTMLPLDSVAVLTVEAD